MDHHIVVSEETRESGNGRLEEEPAVHMDVAYKNKNVKVHISFSEETDDKNAQLFYDSLKKIYIEKINLGLCAQNCLR